MKRSVFIIFALLVLSIAAFVGSKHAVFPPVLNQVKAPQTASDISPTLVPHVTTMHVVYGTVTLSRDGQKQTITQDMSVSSGDIIDTGVDGMGVLSYAEGTVVRIGPNSSLTVKNSASMTEKILHTTGMMYVRFRKIVGVREDFEVETPTAIATVRGTAYGSFIAANKSSKFATTEDTVFVEKKDEASGSGIPQTQKSIETGDQGEVAIGRVTDPTKAVVVSRQKLTKAESDWLNFNIREDTTMASGGADLSVSGNLSNDFFLQFVATPTPTPTPTPLVTPTPTKPPLPTLSSMPGEGYSRSTVKTDSGTFTMTCIGANKNSTRVITDSANEDDCRNDCPVKPLAEYAQNNGGFAAMNGMYFCPADYPACSDKKNSFDTLFFNSRVKRYLNSDNNVYSVLPFLAVEANGNPIFKSKTLEWGRDTGIMAGTAGNPLLVHNGNLVATENGLDEKQKTVKSARGAFAQKGDSIYLCTVAGATVLDSAKVYSTLGADNAMNIDGGGSTALWYNGSYILGPGRNIPTAIIFSRR